MILKDKVEECAKEIRRIAGIYQCGGDMNDARQRVNAALNELGHMNRKKTDIQIVYWNQLLLLLKSHGFNCSDTRWLSVIKYARAKVSARRAGAVMKQKNDEHKNHSSK
ncbi:hypothetical protein H2241_21320 [Pantoea ananatis]|uniref:hypothetical protein n=1 Tax=Pantoea ananas TaxID=553 RepID=UPI00158CDFC7|nr:hypothetical protein [Pantoea ananatis]MBA4823480.1 hypothetical protein [Pantoea ananatis]QKV88017.1 hypothetical protein FOB88_13205 [Pantoea ananatis]